MIEDATGTNVSNSDLAVLENFVNG
jgi:hypothetical protein